MESPVEAFFGGSSIAWKCLRRGTPLAISKFKVPVRRLLFACLFLKFNFSNCCIFLNECHGSNQTDWKHSEPIRTSGRWSGCRRILPLVPTFREENLSHRPPLPRKSPNPAEQSVSPCSASCHLVQPSAEPADQLLAFREDFLPVPSRTHLQSSLGFRLFQNFPYLWQIPGINFHLWI